MARGDAGFAAPSQRREWLADTGDTKISSAGAVDLGSGASTIREIRRTLRERPVASRRRRRNRPGNAQANGPQGDETLESSRAARQGLTDGVSCGSCARSEISQVPRQRGLGRARLPDRVTLPEPVMTQAPDTAQENEAPAAPGEAAPLAPDHPPEAAAIATGDAAPPPAPAPLRQTPLHSLHVSRGARMVPFAGYDMPVQYADGIIAEHNHVRSAGRPVRCLAHGSGVSGRAPITRRSRARSKRWCPPTSSNLAPGRQRYTQFTDENGGILDDLMVTRPADPEEDGVLFLVVNAAMKEADYAHLVGAAARGRAAHSRRASRAGRRAGADGAAGGRPALPRGRCRCRS